MSTVNFLNYDLDSGRIRQRGSCHESDYPHQQIEGMGLMPGWPDPELDYIDLSGAEPLKLPRPTLPGFDKTTIVADDTDTASLTLPGPATVIIDGQEYVITEAPYTIEISSPMPATYVVEIDLWPYLPFKAVITAQ